MVQPESDLFIPENQPNFSNLKIPKISCPFMVKENVALIKMMLFAVAQARRPRFNYFS